MGVGTKMRLVRCPGCKVEGLTLRLVRVWSLTTAGGLIRTAWGRVMGQSRALEPPALCPSTVVESSQGARGQGLTCFSGKP